MAVVMRHSETRPRASVINTADRTYTETQCGRSRTIFRTIFKQPIIDSTLSVSIAALLSAVNSKLTAAVGKTRAARQASRQTGSVAQTMRLPNHGELVRPTIQHTANPAFSPPRFNNVFEPTAGLPQSFRQRNKKLHRVYLRVVLFS